MNSGTKTTEQTEDTSRQEEFAFLFAQLVMQQSNMAMMLLGKVAHPESGKVFQDVDAARLFIDQLEMLEVKTKGNLSKEEESLLKQTLMTLRLNFVQTVESPSTAEHPKPAATPPEGTPSPEAANPATVQEPSGSGDDDHRKKFSKKY
jgi:hypothetical protein